MPWINEGGGGGSWKPTGAVRGDRAEFFPPDLEELLSRWQARIGSGSRAAAADWRRARPPRARAYRRAPSGSFGLLHRRPERSRPQHDFRPLHGQDGPGLNYNLPYPIGEVDKLAVTDRNVDQRRLRRAPIRARPSGQTSVDLPEESLMLTGDDNIADVKFVVIWQIDPVHPEYYAFNIANQRETVKAVAESAMREVIGRGQIQKILTAGRRTIEPEVQELMQKVLNSYKAGVLVLQVQLQSVDPPEQVIAAFRDVIAAQQDQDRLRNEARGLRQQRRAGGARQSRRDRAGRRRAIGCRPCRRRPARPSRFEQIYAEYKKAPDVTRERMYLETMERVLGGVEQGHRRSERARSGGRALSAARRTAGQVR